MKPLHKKPGTTKNLSDDNKVSEKDRLEAHLDTVRALVKERTARVSEIESQMSSSHYDETADLESKTSLSKICQDKLWSLNEYVSYSACQTNHSLEFGLLYSLTAFFEATHFIQQR